MTDVSQTYFDDHFSVCTNMESLCCTPEFNFMSIIPQLKKPQGNKTFLMTKNKKNSYCWRNPGFYSFQMLHILETRAEKKLQEEFRS